MQSVFTIRFADNVIAIADVLTTFGEPFVISRINVPKRYRGLGFGRELLRMITDAADMAGVRLKLAVSPYGDSPLQFKELSAWYRRHGFRQVQGEPSVLLMRAPLCAVGKDSGHAGTVETEG